MLSTEIPTSIWRGEQTRNKIIGRVEDEKDKFYKKPDTNYQASLEQMYGPNQVKRFSFAGKVNEHGLDDLVSKHSSCWYCTFPLRSKLDTQLTVSRNLFPGSLTI
jgi:hypothetical protein